jgi:hypothetical protein
LRGLRISGHERSARYGAVTPLVRNLYPCHARQAHTGAMKCSDSAQRVAQTLWRSGKEMLRRGTPWRRLVHIAVDPANDDMRLGRLLRGKALPFRRRCVLKNFLRTGWKA